MLGDKRSVTGRREAHGGAAGWRPVKVAVICRPGLLRGGLERLLGQAPDLAVSASTEVQLPDGRPSLSIGDRVVAAHRRAAVAILSDRGSRDLAMECETILESVAEEVVVLARRSHIDSFLACVRAGARGFVVEGDRPEALLAAVRSVSHHDLYVSGRLLEPLLDWIVGREGSRSNRVGRGTERDLLRLLAEGRSTADIADRLGIAPKTVRSRASQLYRKLGVHSRTAAVRIAEERGLLD